MKKEQTIVLKVSKIAVLIILIGFISFVFGFFMGQAEAINLCVRVGLKFAESQNINVSLNAGQIQSAINQYKDFIFRLP